MTEQKHDWTIAEIDSIYNLPLPELIFRAQTEHRKFHRADEIQGCQLLSIKTGGCPEDCAYCPQSAHYKTAVEREPLLSVEETLEAARNARQSGATRFCMGAAWRDVPNGEQFETVLKMVRGVRSLGLEACCTLGMLKEDQAVKLAEAGLTAYNHNLDTSPEFYGDIITTRTYEERLETLKNCPQIRRDGLLRRNYRNERNACRPLFASPTIIKSKSASRKRSDKSTRPR